MNADLEETLSEMGGEYRSVVDRLRAAREVEPRAASARAFASLHAPRRRIGWTVGYLAAASLFAAICLSFALQGRGGAGQEGPCRIYNGAYAPDERALEAILASQRADGSWTNDFITRQNAAALRRGESAAAKVAYRRAVRYLRSRGLSPLSDEELRDRGESAARVLAKT